MSEGLSFLYFIGLIMFGIAVGNYVNSAPIGFMIVGGGTILFTAAAGFFSYLKPSK